MPINFRPIYAQRVAPFGERDAMARPAPPPPENPKAEQGRKKFAPSVIPRNVLGELAVAMLEGALKYGRHNWREAPILASDYFDAANRHMDAFWEGEDVDPDSGVSHVTKAIATLVVLRDAMMLGRCRDDRPPRSVSAGWIAWANRNTHSLRRSTEKA